MNNLLLRNLNVNNIDWSILNFQDSWNAIENVIINTVDKLAPVKMFPINPPNNSLKVPRSIKQKLNKRNRLLKLRFDPRHIPQIRSLSNDIKEYFHRKKVSKVKKATLGPKTNIWKAVKVAKDLSTMGLPPNRTIGGLGG
jgi:hypothetical protein